MSALARVLAAKGIAVSGSDMADSATLAALREEGIDARAGHDPANLNGATRVVVSAAIKDDNPEAIAARARDLPVISRSEMLGQLMDRYAVRIAVAGTHGKTTTSAMIAQMLESAGFDPTALIGGDVPAWHANARLGKSELFVAEACEAYGSFLDMRPSLSVVTNIEADHLDYYADLDAILDAFRKFLAQTSGTAVLCADDANCMRLASGTAAKVVRYGLSLDVDVRASVYEASPSKCVVIYRGDPLGELRLAVPGRHNLLNALAAVAVGLELGVPFAKIARGLAEFAGTGRRFERVGETRNGAIVIDDYAHHPTEIRATLAAARSAFPDKRIVAVFQPHLPSRTRDLLDDFATAFADADEVILTDIYLAREKPLEGVTGELLAERVAGARGADRVRYVADKADLPAVLDEMIRPGDVVLTLGAGDITSVGRKLVG